MGIDPVTCSIHCLDATVEAGRRKSASVWIDLLRYTLNNGVNLMSNRVCDDVTKDSASAGVSKDRVSSSIDRRNRVVTLGTTIDAVDAGIDSGVNRTARHRDACDRSAGSRVVNQDVTGINISGVKAVCCRVNMRTRSGPNPANHRICAPVYHGNRLPAGGSTTHEDHVAIGVHVHGILGR